MKKMKKLFFGLVSLAPMFAFAGAPTQVPEPETLPLLAVAVIAAYLLKRKKK